MRWMIAMLIPLLAGAGTGFRDEPATPPVAKEEKIQSPPVDPRVDEVLARLQKRSDGLKDIRCDLTLVEVDNLNISERRKEGKLLFLITPENPQFLIHFEKSVVDDQLGKPEWYLFDGYWLYEALARTKRVVKREIARAGEKVDLFDIETAPFPLPIGQRRDKILRHFDVTLAEPAKGDPKDSDHLVCIPKPGSRLERKYDRLDLFVQKGVDLPCRVVATKTKGLVVITADFPDLTEKAINAGVTAQDFAHPKEWKGFQVTVEPLETGGAAEPENQGGSK